MITISNSTLLLLCCLPALIAGGIVWGLMGYDHLRKAQKDNPFTHWRL